MRSDFSLKTNVTQERRQDICKPNAQRIQVRALMASQLWRANQHEPSCFGLYSPWFLPSQSSILLYIYRSPALAFIEMFCPLFHRFAPFPLVLDCSRPLVGVDAESSGIVQKTPRPLFFLPPYAARAPYQLVLRTSRNSAVSYPPCAPQIPQTRSASCVKSPRYSYFPSV